MQFHDVMWSVDHETEKKRKEKEPVFSLTLILEKTLLVRWVSLLFFLPYGYTGQGSDFKWAYMYNEPSWLWLYGSWIYNYPCNRCLSPLKLWVRTPLRRGVLDTTLCDKVCQLLVTGQWFSPGIPVSFTNENGTPQYRWNIIESGVKAPQIKPIVQKWQLKV
jgi:hypothetical protein